MKAFQSRLWSQKGLLKRLVLSASVLVMFSGWSINGLSQARVVEAGGGNSSQAQANTNAGTAQGSDDVVINLYFQLERLQEEMQTLRGIVEQQSYLMGRMETEQRDRYLDIDRRLSGVSRVVTPEPAPVIVPEPVIAPPVEVASGPVSEQDLYRTALNLLLEDGSYDESIDLFQQYIDTYPAGRFLTNTLYWQGEGLILSGNYSRARDVFNQVINNYGDDPKAPGALLKLGVVYRELGDMGLAIQSWRSIAEDYPASLTEIRAAEDYLRRSGN